VSRALTESLWPAATGPFFQRCREVFGLRRGRVVRPRSELCETLVGTGPVCWWTRSRVGGGVVLADVRSWAQPGRPPRRVQNMNRTGGLRSRCVRAAVWNSSTRCVGCSKSAGALQVATRRNLDAAFGRLLPDAGRAAAVGGTPADWCNQQRGRRRGSWTFGTVDFSGARGRKR